MANRDSRQGVLQQQGGKGNLSHGGAMASGAQSASKVVSKRQPLSDTDSVSPGDTRSRFSKNPGTRRTNMPGPGY